MYQSFKLKNAQLRHAESNSRQQPLLHQPPSHHPPSRFRSSRVKRPRIEEEEPEEDEQEQELDEREQELDEQHDDWAADGMDEDEEDEMPTLLNVVADSSTNVSHPSLMSELLLIFRMPLLLQIGCWMVSRMRPPMTH